MRRITRSCSRVEKSRVEVENRSGNCNGVKDGSHRMSSDSDRRCVKGGLRLRIRVRNEKDREVADSCRKLVGNSDGRIASSASKQLGGETDSPCPIVERRTNRSASNKQVGRKAKKVTDVKEKEVHECVDVDIDKLEKGSSDALPFCYVPGKEKSNRQDLAMGIKRGKRTGVKRKRKQSGIQWGTDQLWTKEQELELLRQADFTANPSPQMLGFEVRRPRANNEVHACIQYKSLMDDDNTNLPQESGVNRSSDEDPPFDPQQEIDKGDPEVVAYDQYMESIDKTPEIELLADGVPSVNNNVPSSAQGGREVGTKKRKGRGPSKGLKVKETMHLEYDSLGQPCGKWRHAYGRQVGACVRKLSIVDKWKDVPEGLKSSFWDETVNLFHIEATEAKRNVFISALAERFRDFKSKLVSGFITLTRKRTMEEGDTKTPPEIWPHVSKEEWEAFVAQKTTPQAIEMRKKAQKSAKSRYHYHAMGPKTFEQMKAIWEKDGLYPTELIVRPSSNATHSTSTSTILTKTKNRMIDWWCSLHGLDENGKRVIKNPATKRLADSLIEWMRKEATGEFIPEPNKDALTMVLGKDHLGRLVGHGGVRLGARKVAASNSKGSSSIQSGVLEDRESLKNELKKELQEEFDEKLKATLQANDEKMLSNFKSLLQQLGVSEQVTLGVVDGQQKEVVPEDQSSR